MSKKLVALNIDSQPVIERLRKLPDPKPASVKTVSKLMSALEADNRAIAETDSVALLNVTGLSADETDQLQKKKMKKKIRTKLCSLSYTRKPGRLGQVAQRAFQPPNRVERSTGNQVALLEKSEKATRLVLKRFAKPGKSQPKDQICESDRFIGTRKPRHLFSGKRGIGKTSHR